MSLDTILTKHTSNSDIHNPGAPHKSGSFPVWLIPILIILGFASLFLIVLWPQLRPAVEVEVARALPILNSGGNTAKPSDPRQQSVQEPQKLLFQAAGWLEPNPLPERVSSLVSGTVAKTHVTDGDKVERGQLLAELVDSDYKFALDDASAQLMEAKADVGLRETEVETAKAQIRMEEADLRAVEARLKNLKDTYERYSKLSSGVISEQAIFQAEQDLRQQEALVNVAEAKLETGKTGLNESAARLTAAKATYQKAEVGYQHAKLNLERCKIYSPITGRVLKMLSTPGSRLNVEADQEDASTLAHLYNPEELALRMDVPIEQAGNVFVGQPSKITCAMFPDKTYTGIVVRIAGEADIQRNALQVRIRLDNPDDMLRPSMPCRAEVYNKASSPRDSQAPSSENLTTQSGEAGVLIPENALQNKDNAPYVWVVDMDNKAVKKSITLSSASGKDQFITVSGDVYPGDPVIINPPSSLQENDRVTFPTL